jgi:hypothetical protein
MRIKDPSSNMVSHAKASTIVSRNMKGMDISKWDRTLDLATLVGRHQHVVGNKYLLQGCCQAGQQGVPHASRASTSYRV